MKQHVNLICFSLMPWSKMWKRNQSMVAELSRSVFIDKTIFINPEVDIRTIRNHYNINPLLRGSIKEVFLPVKQTAEITTFTPLYFLPFKHKVAQIRALEKKIILASIKNLNKKQPYILLLNCPQFTKPKIIEELIEAAALVLFDLSDDFLEYKLSSDLQQRYQDNIKTFVQASDLVLAVNDHVRDKFQPLNPNIITVRNATNYANFARSSYEPCAEMEAIKQQGPVLGYIGWLNMSRINCELVDAMVRWKKNWQVVFIGRADNEFRDRYSSFKNVHILPPVMYTQLPNYMNSFDAGVVPFSVNEHTRGNDLLKLYDYLALGKPVVSSICPDNLLSVVSRGDTVDSFIQYIESALVEQQSAELMIKRREVARHHSWKNRVQELESLMEEALQNKWNREPV